MKGRGIRRKADSSLIYPLPRHCTAVCTPPHLPFPPLPPCQINPAKANELHAGRMRICMPLAADKAPAAKVTLG